MVKRLKRMQNILELAIKKPAKSGCPLIRWYDDCVEKFQAPLAAIKEIPMNDGPERRMRILKLTRRRIGGFHPAGAAEGLLVHLPFGSLGKPQNSPAGLQGNPCGTLRYPAPGAEGKRGDLILLGGGPEPASCQNHHPSPWIRILFWWVSLNRAGGMIWTRSRR